MIEVLSLLKSPYRRSASSASSSSSSAASVAPLPASSARAAVHPAAGRDAEAQLPCTVKPVETHEDASSVGKDSAVTDDSQSDSSPIVPPESVVAASTVHNQHGTKPSDSTRDAAARRQRKTVRFQETPSVVLTVPAISDYTRDEYLATWYSREECQAIKKSVQDVVITHAYLVANKQHYRLKKLCMRGLESTFGKELKLKTERRRQHLYAIRTVQQKVRSDEDAEQMARMSQQLTAGTLREAIQRAEEDQKAASKHCQRRSWKLMRKS